MRQSVIFAVLTVFSGLFGSLDEEAILLLEKSFDWEGMDSKVSPSDDFYQYAVGTWVENTQIPEGHPKWGAFHEIRQNNVKKIQSLFQDKFIAKTHEEKLLYHFYHSFLDTKKQDKQGVTPLKKILSAIDRVKTRKELVQLIGNLHSQGFSPVFTQGVLPHPYDNTKNILWFGQAKINLPDYEIYLEKFDTQANKHESQRKAYQSYIKKIFNLLGVSDDQANADSKKVFELEKMFAYVFYTKEQARDVKLSTNIYSKEQLKEEIPFSYDLLFSTMEIDPKQINIINPKLLKELVRIVENEDIDTIKTYIKFSCVNSLATALGKEFFDAHFALYSKTLSGIEKPKPIEERAIDLANSILRDPLGKVYVSRFFQPEKKEIALEMVDHIKNAFVKKIDHLTWLEEPTKKKAIEKLQKMIVQIGYPDEGHWVDYSSVTHLDKNKSLAENLLTLYAFHAKDDFQKLKKPVDPYAWQMGAQVVNACNVPLQNKIIFPAGILQAPFFADDPAICWGAFGMVISHEIIHSFDDQGRQFDANGNLNNWWQEKDKESFESHAKVIKEQFDAYTLTFSDGTKEHVRGQLCLGENIADLGGLTIAFEAFEEFQKKHYVPTIKGFTPEQRFFLGCAQVFKSKDTDSHSKLMINNDPHSPSIWRINGSFSQMPAFKKAFNLKGRCPMVISDEKRSKMWNS